MRPCSRFLVAACLVLAAASSAQPTRTPEFTPEQEAAYGNRARFFRNVGPEARPDLDWRTALSKTLADVEPRWSQGFEELIIRDFFGEKEGGFYVDVGWGTWGFKAGPVAGEQTAELVATGRTPELIAAFGHDRFAEGNLTAEKGAAAVGH